MHARSFFESLDDLHILFGMTRPRADVREPNLLQQRPDMPLMLFDAEALDDHPLQIGPPPSHHAVLLPIGASFDDRRKFGELIWRQPRSRTTGPVVQQTVGPAALKR